MKNYDFDGFTVSITFDEDGDWLAYLVELPGISAFASEPKDALKELKKAWEASKESYRKNKEEIPIAPARKNYSGQFNVRIDKRLHKALAMEAAQAGISLNALVTQKLYQNTENFK